MTDARLHAPQHLVEEDRQLVAAFEAGQPLQQIAADLGRERSWVALRLKQLGLQPEKKAEASSLTVSQLNDKVRRVLAGSFAEAVWVTAEIARYDDDVGKAAKRAKGQVYFELIEKDVVTHQLKASASAVLWGAEMRAVVRKLRAIDGSLALRDGVQVRLLCNVDFYAPRGQFQLRVLDVDPVFSLGQMAQRRALLLKQLATEGLLDQNRSLPFPVLPLRIGLITSKGSAAFHDFVNELQQSRFRFKVVNADAQVQGNHTPFAVPNALERLCQRGDFDVIVIARGGGSNADLSWFNDERVARAIALCPLPVLTGIGHQIDRTVADEVAARSFKTPTAVAQFLVSRIAEGLREVENLFAAIAGRTRELMRRELDSFTGLVPRLHMAALRDGRLAAVQLEEASARLMRRAGELRQREFDGLEATRQGLVRETKRQAFGAWQQLDETSRSLERTATAGLRRAQEFLAQAPPVLSGACGRKVTLQAQSLVQTEALLAVMARQRLQLERGSMASCEAQVQACDPARLLRRGFALLQGPDGSFVTRAQALHPGDTIIATLADGRVQAEVTHINGGAGDRGSGPEEGPVVDTTFPEPRSLTPDP
ncbi:MAG: exodeoxyribonuclease VII large subunit [Candidatus Xenobia bacterium]